MNNKKMKIQQKKMTKKMNKNKNYKIFIMIKVILIYNS